MPRVRLSWQSSIHPLLTHHQIKDTVERNILDLAARQGQSLYTKDNSAGTVEVSFVPETGRQSASTINKRKVQKVQKGDFIYK
jgi:E3 ubiquitin-protein ligase SHPRH